MGETRVCRVCKVEKLLDRAHWPAWQTKHSLYYRPQCKPCYNVTRYPQARRRGRTWEEKYQAIEARSRFVLVGRTIPESDPHLDLEVVDICWRDCVSEGQEAITRMVKRLVSICWSLPHADRLSCASVGYLDGMNSLAMVRSRLDELVSLARSA